MAPPLSAFATPLLLPTQAYAATTRLTQTRRMPSRRSAAAPRTTRRTGRILGVASDPQVVSAPTSPSPTDTSPTDTSPIVTTSFDTSQDLLEKDNGSAITSLEDVHELVELVEECDLQDLRIVHNGVMVEITRPGGRGFDADGCLKEDRVQSSEPARGVPEYVEYAEEEPEGLVDDSDWEVADSGDGVSEEGDGEVAKEDAVEEKDPNTVYESDFVVTSNRVGFFFCGAKNKPPLVNLGDRVEYNQPVCIIEQLGQQYVYLSEASGTVVKVFMEDGDAVEYGTQIMIIRPD